MPAPPSPVPGTDRSLRRETAPLLAAYWSFGQYWGVFTILLLEFQARHGFSDGAVGAQLTVLSVASVLTMLVGAPRLQALPLAVCVPLALTTLAVGAVSIGLFPTAWIPVAAILLGIGNGLIDIYLNVAAQRVEIRTHCPVLQWLHACYALGGVTGAAVAGLLRTLGLDYRLGFVYAGVTLCLTAAWNAATASRERGPAGVRATFSVAALRRTPFLWIPAIALLGAFLIEGSMDVWSGLYLRADLGTTAMVAAFAFMAFSGASFFGRLFAGRVLFGMGRRTTILLSGIGSGLAGLVAVLTRSPLVVGVAFLALGFLLSAAAPAAFGLVGEARDEDPSAAIAAVTTIGYTGFIWSPPLIGWIAAAVGLRAAMGFVVACTLAIVGAGLLTPRERNDPRG